MQIIDTQDMGITVTAAAGNTVVVLTEGEANYHKLVAATQEPITGMLIKVAPNTWHYAPVNGKAKIVRDLCSL